MPFIMASLMVNILKVICIIIGDIWLFFPSLVGVLFFSHFFLALHQDLHINFLKALMMSLVMDAASVRLVLRLSSVPFIHSDGTSPIMSPVRPLLLFEKKVSVSLLCSRLSPICIMIEFSMFLSGFLVCMHWKTWIVVSSLLQYRHLSDG